MQYLIQKSPNAYMGERVQCVWNFSFIDAE